MARAGFKGRSRGAVREARSGAVQRHVTSSLITRPPPSRRLAPRGAGRGRRGITRRQSTLDWNVCSRTRLAPHTTTPGSFFLHNHTDTLQEQRRCCHKMYIINSLDGYTLVSFPYYIMLGYIMLACRSHRCVKCRLYSRHIHDPSAVSCVDILHCCHGENVWRESGLMCVREGAVRGAGGDRLGST